MNEGDTFTLVDVADHHLWVIISDPVIDDQNVLFVNFTSWDSYEDQTVILDVWDHPFIKHRTCVAYSRARVSADVALQRLATANRLALHDPASDDLLKKLRDGAVASNRTKNEHLQLLVNQGIVDL